MTVIRVKGLKCWRHPVSGIEYIYHRKTGTRITAKPGTPEFFDQVSDAERKLAGRPKAPRVGTLGALIAEYRASHQFRELRPRTRADYDNVLSYLAPVSDAPLLDIDRAWIVKLRDRVFAQRKRAFANYVLAVMSIVLSFGAERGEIDGNPARGVRKIRRRSDAPVMNRPWTAAERDRVLAIAPPHLIVPLAIGRWTGLREGDVVRLPKTAYDGAVIRIVTGKRGVPVVLPVAQPLREFLAAAPPHQAMTLIANSRGRPWTQSGFRASLFKFLRTVEAAAHFGKSSHAFFCQ